MFRLRNAKSEDDIQGTSHSESHVSGTRQYYGWHAAQRVSVSRGFALGLKNIRTQRAGKSISGRRSGRLAGNRESQSLNEIVGRNRHLSGIGLISRGRRRGRENGKSHCHGSSAKEEGGE